MNVAETLNSLPISSVVEVRESDILAAPVPDSWRAEEIQEWVLAARSYFASIGLPCRAVLPVPGGVSIQALRAIPNEPDPL